LEREQAHHRGLVERIAAQAPDALGGIGEQATCMQDGHGPVDVVLRVHGRSLAKSGGGARCVPPPRYPVQNGALSSAFFTTRLRPGSNGAAVTSGRAGSTSPDRGRAAFFAAAFFAGAFLVAAFFEGTFLAAAFFAAAFFAPKPRRAGLPVSSSRRVASSRVRLAGSRSLGILPLRRPSLRYGPKRPLS